MRDKHQKAAASMASLRHCRRLFINESLLVESVDSRPHSAPVAGSFTFPPYPSPESLASAASFAELIESRANLPEKLDRLLQERKMPSAEHQTSDQDQKMQEDEQTAMADQNDDKRATSQARDNGEEDKVEEASEQDAGARLTSEPPAAVEPQARYSPRLPPPYTSIWGQSRSVSRPNLPALQQATNVPYDLPSLGYHHPLGPEPSRRDNYRTPYCSWDPYQQAFYSEVQHFPTPRYGNRFPSYEWTPLSAQDPWAAAPSQMIGSGHIEQQPFGQHPSIRQSANSMQIGGNYRNSAQYGARHESSSFETADSSSPRQASLDIPTNTISRGLDSHQTNHYSHRQLQASYSYPHPAYVGYGNLGQSAAIYPPPPGFPSYPTYASQNFGYGFAPQQSSRNPPGQAANYVQDTSNPGTATFSSSALAHNRTAFRPSTRGDFETPDEDDNNVRSRRLPRSMDQEEVPHSRVRPRRRRPSPRRRTISRRSAHTSRSKKETVKHEASTPSDTPHTIDPVVNEMIERFQRRQPEVRQKQRPSYVSRGTWSTREEAFAIELMKVTKTSQYRGTIEDLWHIISNAMRAEGMERSAAAVKNQWNRSLRWKSKFDERARKKPGAMRTGINNYPEPKFRLAERRKRQQESSGDTESVPNRHGSVETTGSNETDNDEKMEREHESDDTADTQERQPLAMNANRARVPAGGDSTAAENGFTHSASIRARGCHDEDLDASETDEDMDDGN